MPTALISLPRLIGRFRTVWRRAGRWVRQAFEPDIVDTCCVSVLASKPVRLPRHYVHDASEVLFEVTVRKPLLALRRRQDLLVEFWHCAAPALSGFQVVHLRSLRPYRLARARLRVPPAAHADRAGLRAVIVNPVTGQVLATRRLSSLDEAGLVPYTRQQVLRELRLDKHEIWVQAGRLRYRSDQLPASSDSLTIALNLRSKGFNASVREWVVPLRLSVAASQRQVLSEHLVALRENACLHEMLSVSVQSSPLAKMPPGFCRLVLGLGERDIATFPLWIVGDQELLNQLRIRDFAIDAPAANGREQAQVRIVRRNRCRSLRCSIVLETPIPAPNTSFPVVVDWSSEGAILHRVEFRVALDRLSQVVRLPSLDVTALTLNEPGQAQELTVRVHVAEALKYSTRLLILPDESITNCEGQLNVNADELPVHDAEYEEILNRLDLAKHGS
jgi:hypothetical protein